MSSQRVPPLVLLVGGMGTRIRHLHPTTPKPLVPVAGRPWLAWLVRYFERQGVTRIVLSSGYRAEQMDAFVAQTAQAPERLVSVTETEPLGTAGGFVHALAGLTEPASHYLVANGDSIVLTSLRSVLAAAIDDNTVDVVMLGLRVDDASRFGTLEVDAAGFLKGFTEKRAGRGLINAGVYVIRADAVRNFPSKRPLSFEYDVFPDMLARGRNIRVIGVEAPFIDIGTEASLAEAGGFIERNKEWFE